MKKLILAALSTLFLTTPAFSHYDDLVYGDYEHYFELGEVDFYRATGFYNGKESDYNVSVVNNYPFEVCLVPSFEIIKNGRIDYLEPSFILPPNSTTELGHYGAENFGKSWHVKWDFLVSQNLEYCAI